MSLLLAVNPGSRIPEQQLTQTHTTTRGDANPCPLPLTRAQGEADSPIAIATSPTLCVATGVSAPFP